MSKRNIIIGIVVVLIVIFGIYFTKAKNSGAPTSTTDTVAQTPPPPTAVEPPPAVVTPPPVAQGECVRTYDSSKLTQAVDIKNKFVTLSVANYGDIKVQLFDQDAPKTVENFLKLTNAGFYNCLTFHRIAKGFVIQGGDPNGDGTGGVSAFGKEFADELNPNTPSYKAGYVKGVLAMANRGPNTNSSQFFILIGDATQILPHQYTIFGKVVAGESVTDAIGNADIIPNYAMNPQGTDGTPKTKIVITQAIISNK